MPYHRPLNFFSQAVYERELIAGVGKAFRGVDRPKMFEIFLEQWVVGGKYQKWIAKLLGYDFVIEYKEDALTRLPPTLELGLLCVVGMKARIHSYVA